ncbi:MAG: helix-turn-helix domain-containing protein [Erythrobacter sp.]|uniref:helix-turn-helix domain-containing protein n=1 Tax=Erythrobacter sp. TaxID=1042 RepID=UPI0025EA1133|nr:helix-turn-helix transcriptional regulator [Erythrobacter sp.]MCL9998468.1 helix-turn-helix domain-containing protein [Erythrobacter sp.]
MFVFPMLGNIAAPGTYRLVQLRHNTAKGRRGVAEAQAMLSLARVGHGPRIGSALKPKHQIANEVGIHRETMLKVMRGERAISIDRAVRFLEVCSVSPHAIIVLTLAGEEVLACEWMHREMGEFLDEFIISLPGQLDRTLGRRVDYLRPRWATGTSQLVAKLLSRHIDDLANRDIAMSLTR